MGNRICPVCGGNHTEVIRKIEMRVPENYRLPDSYNVVVCDNCGFVYADTAASMEDLDWYYSNFNFYGDDSKDDNSLRFEMVEEFLLKYITKESVMLEIGAGNGRFEVALKQHGYLNITGADPSEESVRRLRETGIEAYVASIYSEVAPEETEKYDCIFLFEVAEHLLIPGKGMDNVAKMLKKNGVFMISVPDYSEIEDDMSSIPNHFNLEHINYFSAKSLDYLMALHGMERIAQKHDAIDLIQVYRKADQTVLPEKDTATKNAVCSYFRRQEERAERIKSVIETLKKEKTELVIWGTGSYVMSLLATTNLSQCNIKGFVDNNKIKQGMEIYGYTVYSPEYLEDQHCTVLICSMLYGERIREQLEEMHTENEVVLL